MTVETNATADILMLYKLTQMLTERNAYYL